MTEPQVWTLIGVFAAALVGVITLVTTTFMHSLRTSTGSIEKQIGALEHQLETRTQALQDQLETRTDALRQEMRTGFAQVERDISFLYRRDFGDPPAS